MRLVALAVVCACGSGVAPMAKKPTVELGDPSQIEALLRGSVTNGGLWFEDATCAATFGHPGDIPPAQFHAFAQCLSQLGLMRSARKDALDDVAVYQYGGGFEVEARVMPDKGGPRLAWIGFASRASAAEPPTITTTALESLRTGGEPDGPLDGAVAATLTLDPTRSSHAEFAWLKVCLDETGAVSGVTPYAATSPAARDAFAAAVQKWTFRPFVLGGQPAPVCAMVRPSYPSGEGPEDETLPFPLPPPTRTGKVPVVLVSGAKIFESKRLRGDKFVTPDDDTKSAIADSGNPRTIGSFRVCIAEDGTVESVQPIMSTGYASYDQRIVAAIHNWAYSPFTVHGEPTPVCTAVTFIYTQR